MTLPDDTLARAIHDALRVQPCDPLACRRMDPRRVGRVITAIRQAEATDAEPSAAQHDMDVAYTDGHRDGEADGMRAVLRELRHWARVQHDTDLMDDVEDWISDYGADNGL